jgi:hypothetical protein
MILPSTGMQESTKPIAFGFDKKKTFTTIATSKEQIANNKMKIVIINYGAGNIQSIMFAIERLGFKAVLSNNPDEIRQTK